MSVRININENTIILKEEGAWKKVLPMLSSEILTDCNEYCKRDTGMLIASSLTHSRLNEGVLVWQTPYAARQYYEIRTAYKDKNPKATWRWVEVAKQHRKDRWERKAREIARYYG